MANKPDRNAARKLSAVMAGVFVLSLMSGAVAQATETTTRSYGTTSPASVSIQGGPSVVTGWEPHCSQRMRERRVTQQDVQLTVTLYWGSAKWQPRQRTWLYHNTQSNLYVVLRDSGVCVTVW
ncbi:hypothetical protein [Amycolatopsis sp. NPDC059021]|uniref:hypothetical protein n=1 Tax=Amycolatopsis sp. NPDC059021 TaxID=3346704 RepID=UPI00366CE0A9